jgi:branched-chain amino acid transport system substrate-binding protein
MRTCKATVAAVACAAALIAGCNSDTPSEFDGKVKIAVAVPLSGDLADFGLTITDGVRLAARDKNEAGGLLGREVVVEAFDDKANKDGGAVAAARQVIRSGAKVVIGHFNSSASIAAAPLYAAAGILQITPTSTNPRLTQLNIDTLFRVAPTDAAQGPRLADLIIEAGHKRPAAIYQDGDPATDYAAGLVESTVAALTRKGVNPAALAPFTPGTKDWTQQLQAVRDSGADSLLVVAEAPQSAAILVQARELGVELPVYAGDSAVKTEFVLRSGSAAEGATLTGLLPDIVSGPKQDADLVAEYRQQFGRNPGIDTPAGLAAAQVWFAGVEQAKSFDPDAVAKALRSDRFALDSPIGPISYDEKGDLRRQRLYVFRVQEGQIRQVA